MSGGLGDFSMFDLFKAEAEAHCAVLNAGLLAIESNPDDLGQIEPLMRAAHSIKGAARIIGFGPVVTLAHAMEDCLVAVQKGSEHLTAGRVDQLLRGVDLLQEIGELTEADVAGWTEAHEAAIQELTDAVRGPAPAGDAPAPESPAPPPPAEPAPQAPAVEEKPAATAADAAPSPGSAPEQPARDSAVRVGAGSLDRMMQLASESMIASRRFQTLHRAMGDLPELQRRLSTAFDEIARDPGEASAAAVDQARSLSGEVAQVFHRHAADLEHASWRSERLSTALYHEVLGSRMRPFAEGVTAFPRLVRDLARELGKRIRLEITGRTVPVDRDILARLEAPLNHVLRNCVDHGIETPDARRAAGKDEQGQIVLAARHHAGMLTVEVRDDGRGIDPEMVRQRVVERGLADPALAAELSHAELMEFLFLPGFSTARQVTEVSGRGVGLDVVQSMVQEVSGTARVESQPGRWTRFTFRLPVTLSVIRALLVDVAGEPYAFPLARIARVVRVDRGEIQPVEGRQQFMLDGESVGLVDTADLLGVGAAAPAADGVRVVLLGQAGRCCGLVVDRFLGEQDLVVRPLDRRLSGVAHVSAAAVLENGDPLLILDVEDLFQSVQQLLGQGRLRGMRTIARDQESRRRRILVVDDSITVREAERQLLVRHGYEVDVAVDGRDGLNALRARPYDLLITDVDMPRLNGIELIRALRQEQRFADLPIVIVSYKDRQEDRLLGLEVGANAYLTKSSFHDDSLIATVGDLIGGART